MRLLRSDSLKRWPSSFGSNQTLPITRPGKAAIRFEFTETPPDPLQTYFLPATLYIEFFYLCRAFLHPDVKVCKKQCASF